MFRNKSIELVKQKHPLWPGSLVEDVARVVFETVAKEFMEETLLLDSCRNFAQSPCGDFMDFQIVTMTKMLKIVVK